MFNYRICSDILAVVEQAMRILFLGSSESKLVPFIEHSGNSVLCTMERLSPEFLIDNQIDFLVSYGYRYILKPSVLDILKRPSVNLHISLLPWNKGADPNLWSFLENTPKGVTIHEIDSGVDTGRIIKQKEITFDPFDTLRTTYQKLTTEIETLFFSNWKTIAAGEYSVIEQNEIGTFHLKKDKEKYQHLLCDGWDTRVDKLVGAAL